MINKEQFNFQVFSRFQTIVGPELRWQDFDNKIKHDTEHPQHPDHYSIASGSLFQSIQSRPEHQSKASRAPGALFQSIQSTQIIIPKHPEHPDHYSKASRASGALFQSIQSIQSTRRARACQSYHFISDLINTNKCIILGRRRLKIKLILNNPEIRLHI